MLLPSLDRRLALAAIAVGAAVALAPAAATAAGSGPTTTTIDAVSPATHTMVPVTVTATVRSTTGAPLSGVVRFRNGIGLDAPWDTQLGLWGGGTCPGTSSTCTVSTTGATLVPAPTVNRIYAYYEGDEVNAASESPIVEVTEVAWATTTPTVRPRSATTVYGQPLEIDTRLALDPPAAYPFDTTSGWYRFGVQATDLATGRFAVGSGNPGTISFGGLEAGSHRIAVRWSNISVHPLPVKAPEPVVFEHVVQKARTSLALDADVSGAQARLTARLTTIAPGAGTGTGEVVFTRGDDAKEVVGRAPVGPDGTATTAATLPPGAHVVRAWYGGDGNFEPSSMERVVRIDAPADPPPAPAPAPRLIDVTPKPRGVIVTRVRCTKGDVTVTATWKGERYARSTKTCVGRQRIVLTPGLHVKRGGKVRVTVRFSDGRKAKAKVELRR